jgi:hypothetical protein
VTAEVFTEMQDVEKRLATSDDHHFFFPNGTVSSAVLEPKRRAIGSELLAALQLLRSWTRASFKTQDNKTDGGIMSTTIRTTYQISTLYETTTYMSGISSRSNCIQLHSLGVQSDQSANQVAMKLPENTNN